MNDDEESTQRDLRSPYEHILGELNEIKALLKASSASSLGPRVRRLELYAWVPLLAALAVAACGLVR